MFQISQAPMPEPRPLYRSAALARERRHKLRYLCSVSDRVGEFFWRLDFKRDTSATTRDLLAITKSTNKEKMAEDLRQPYIAILLG